MIIPTTLALALAVAAPPAPAAILVCSPDPEPPEYYRFPLVTTKNVPGTGLTEGVGHVTHAPSPYGVSLAPDGSYLLDVHLAFDRLPEPRGDGEYVVWATTTQVDEVERLGVLEVDEDGPPPAFTGRVGWNKFLVVVTLEPGDDPGGTMWKGPIVLRGMSRSGAMHTMAGHGPFQEENCAAYGYDD